MSRVKLGDVAFERKETLKNNTGYPTYNSISEEAHKILSFLQN